MSTPGTRPQQAGWYPDPAGSGGYRWHDGQGWTGQVTHGSPSASATLGKGFARLGDVLGWFLVLCGIVCLLGAGGFAYLASSPPDLTALDAAATGTAVDDTASGVAGVVLIGDLVLLGVTLLAGVTWLVWQHRLAVAAPVRLKRSPAMHVVWWFVPVANLVVPRLCIGDLWHAYSARSTGSPSEPTPVVFWGWWALWLSPMLLTPVMFVSLAGTTTYDGAFTNLAWTTALLFLAQAGAAFAARAVVRSLSWRALLYYAGQG
jgi:hypothetical protein